MLAFEQAIAVAGVATKHGLVDNGLRDALLARDAVGANSVLALAPASRTRFAVLVHVLVCVDQPEGLVNAAANREVIDRYL